MYRVNRWISILTLVFVVAGNVFAQKDRRREEIDLQKKHSELLAQVNALKKEHDRVKAARWQDKRNAIAAQDAFQQNWEDLKREVDKLSAQKTRKEETFLRVRAQKTEKKDQADVAVARYQGFTVQLKDKIRQSQEKLGSAFPHDREENSKFLQKQLETLSQSSIQATLLGLSGYFNFQKEMLELTEKRSVVRSKFVVQGVAAAMEAGQKQVLQMDENSGARSVAGHFIQVGSFFKTFVSSESPDVAVLVKTGRMDDHAWRWVENITPDDRQKFRNAITSLLAPEAGRVGLPMDVILKNANSEGFVITEKTSFWAHMEKEFEEGGWVMYPIMFVALMGLFVIMERAFVFIRKDERAAARMKKVQSLVAAGNVDSALKEVNRSKSSVSKVIAAILAHASNRSTAEEKAHEVMLQETPKLETRISTINILAAASPLVGLLGTVSGMVTLFGVITVHGTSDPKLMAGGISEALIATKWGLGVAVPLLIFYNLMDLWAGRITTNMEKYSAQLMNQLNEKYYAEKDRDVAATPSAEAIA